MHDYVLGGAMEWKKMTLVIIFAEYHAGHLNILREIMHLQSIT